MKLRVPFLALVLALVAGRAYAQSETSRVIGVVTDVSGGALPGVTIEARSAVLPGPRTAVTATNGSYQLAALPPGEYTVQFTLQGMQTVTRKAQVLLSQDVAVNVTLSIQSVSETVTVTATAGLVEKTTAAINSTLANEIFNSLRSEEHTSELQSH